jgi:uncharacterized protein YhjY with autotransporter beta-barrel domain
MFATERRGDGSSPTGSGDRGRRWILPAVLLIPFLPSAVAAVTAGILLPPDMAQLLLALGAEDPAVGLETGDGDDTIEIAPGETIEAESNDAPAEATGVGTSGGTDTVTNAGTVTADADSRIRPRIRIPQLSELPFPEWRADPETEATATGIAGGDGNDTLTSSGTTGATSSARVKTVDVSGTVAGVVTASVESKATSKATGLDGGDGDDTISDTGTINADAFAKANGLALSVSGNGQAAWKGDLTADASATGIAGGAGADAITSGSTIEATATTRSGSADVTASLTDVRAGLTASTVKARAAGIDAGGGDDVVVHTGDITALARSRALAVDTQFSSSDAEEGESTGVSSASSASDGGTNAEALAVGIDADGEDDTSTSTVVRFIDDGIRITRTSRTDSGGGDDAVTNAGSIEARSRAITATFDVEVGIDNAASAVSTSKAEAKSIGVRAGDGDDAVTNTGDVLASATANADALSGSFSGKGEAKIADSAWDGGTTAEATAVGLEGDTDAEATNERTVIEVDVDLGRLERRVRIDHDKTVRAARGDDTIANDGFVKARSLAGTASLGVGATVEGAASAAAKSTAEATSLAVRGGGGDDVLTNDGELIASSTSGAAALSVSVSGKADAKLGDSASEQSVTAKATSVGIEGDGTADTTTRTDLGIDVDLGGLRSRVTFDDEKIVEALSGDDVITNAGSVKARSFAGTATADADLKVEGAASAGTTSTAEAGSWAIRGGGGDDEIVNTIDGELVATSVAGSAGVSVAVTAKGDAKLSDKATDGGTTARASAVGIDGDGDAESTTTRSKVDVDVDVGRLRSRVLVDHGSLVEAASGDDRITNDGTVKTRAVAGAASVDVALAVQDTESSVLMTEGEVETEEPGDDGGEEGEASADALAPGDGDGEEGGEEGGGEEGGGEEGGGEGDDPGIDVEGAASSASRSTAESMTAAIRGGDGDDEITNRGEIRATSLAAAASLTASVTAKGDAEIADSASDGGTTATASAVGIDADGDAQTTGTRTRVEVDANVGALQGRVSVDRAKRAEHAGGDDRVMNDATVKARSFAVTVTQEAGATVEGAASVGATSTAEAMSTAIRAGGGDDVVANTGTLKAISVAGGAAQTVAVTAKGDAKVSDSASDGGTTATAAAVGIDGDAAIRSERSRTSVDVVADVAGGRGRVTVEHERIVESATGDDVIVNDGVVKARSSALTGDQAVAITVEGSASAASASTSTATSTAIRAGGGDDAVMNTGELKARSFAGAFGLAGSFSGKERGGDDPGMMMGGEMDAGDGEMMMGGGMEGGGDDDGAVEMPSFDFDGRTTATATAQGIDGDSDARSTESRAAVDVAVDIPDLSGEISVFHEKIVESADGDDLIDNSALIDVRSTAIAASLDVDATVKGAASARSLSSAAASSGAVRGGGGDDVIENSGELKVNSAANADTARVAVTPKGIAVTMDGGTTAEATSRGIEGDGGAASTRSATSVDIEFDIDERSGSVSILNEHAVRSSSGGDRIINAGEIDSKAVAILLEADVPVAVKGVAAAVTSSDAKTTVSAIDAGDGGDFVHNTARLESRANSTAVTAKVAVTTSGLAATVSGTSADAASVGIAGDGDGVNSTRRTSFDAITGQNELLTSTDETVETSGEDGGTVTTTATIVSETDGGEVSFLNDVVLESASGDDVIRNRKRIDAVAKANILAIDVPVAVKGAAASLTTSSSTSTATAIDAGDGSDRIMSHGRLEATAIARAVEASVAVTTSGAAVNIGGPTADATAVGLEADGDGSNTRWTTSIETRGAADRSTTVATTAITTDTGGDPVSTMTSTERSRVASGIEVSFSDERVVTSASGDDVVVNTGTVDATARAWTATVDVPVAVQGVAAALTTSTARASATALDLGDGSDELWNRGRLDAKAEARALSASVPVASTGLALAVGGPTAVATATGIDADGDGSNLRRITTLDVSGESIEETFGTSLTVDADGSTTATTESYSRSGGSELSLLNERVVESASGDDVLFNEREIDVIARALAPGLDVPVGLTGVAAGLTFSTARSAAKGIGAGDGSDMLENTGEVTVLARSTAARASIPISTAGLAVTLGGPDADATAIGIDMDGDGSNRRTTTSLALSAADVEESGSSEILRDAGGGVSATEERLRATSDRSASFLFENVVESASGDDFLFNDALVDVRAKSLTPDLAVPVGVTGVAAGITTARAGSLARGVSLGDGDDEFINTDLGRLDIRARSTAVTANVPVTTAGLALAVNGPTAESQAFGIEADGDGSNTRFLLTLDASAEADESSSANGSTGEVASSDELGSVLVGPAVAFRNEWSVESASGDDVVMNDAEVDVSARALAPGADVPVGVTGVAVALTRAKSESLARAVSLGDGSDDLMNSGDVTVFSKASAVRASVPVTTAGVALTIGGPTAESAAFGIDADGDGSNLSRVTTVDVSSGTLETTTELSEELELTETELELDAEWSIIRTASDVDVSYRNERTVESASGDDMIHNDGTVDVKAKALAPELNVPVGVTGVAAAVTLARARAEARSFGLGDGDDVLMNDGEVKTLARSTAVSASVPVSVAGLALSVGGPSAESAAYGIDADGDASNRRWATALDATADEAVTTITERIEESDSLEDLEGTRRIALSGAFDGTNVGVSFMNERTVESASGDDLVINEGRLDVEARAFAPGADVPVGVTGVAVGLTTSRTESLARAMSLGDGDDELMNDGEIEVLAKTTAARASIPVTTAGLALSVGGPSAESTAFGVDMDGDGSNLRRATTIDATSEAFESTTTLAETAEVALGASDLTVGIEQTQVATDLDVAFRSERVIESASGSDLVLNRAPVTVESEAAAAGISVPVGVAGVAAGVTWARTKSTARGFGLGDGDDEMTNLDTITVRTRSTAVSASIPVSVAGVGLSVGGPSSTSEAYGIDADGSGANVRSTTTLETTADTVETTTSRSRTLGQDLLELELYSLTDESAAEFEGEGLGVVFTNERIVESASGDDLLFNHGHLDVEARAFAPGLDVPVGVTGVAAGLTRSASETTARAVSLGDGDDEFHNTGQVDVLSKSSAVRASIPVTTAGLALSVGGPTAEAAAFGVEADGDGSNVRRTTVLTTEADTYESSSMTSRGFSFGPIIGEVRQESEESRSGSMVDVSYANERIVESASGDDFIDNAGVVHVESKAFAPGLDVPVAVAGVAAGVTWSRTQAETRAFGLGDGDDVMMNSGTITALSRSRAVSASIPVTGAGVAMTIGGPAAESRAYGIDGDGDGSNSRWTTTLDATATSFESFTQDDRTDDYLMTAVGGPLVPVPIRTTTSTTIDLSATDVSVAFVNERVVESASGNDLIINDGELIVESRAFGPGLKIPVGVVGVAASVTSSKSEAAARGIGAGDGSDEVQNTGAIDIHAKATAVRASIPVTGVGLSLSIGGATAESAAYGIDADGDGTNFRRTTTVDSSADSIDYLTSNDTITLVGVPIPNFDAVLETEGIGLDVVFHNELVRESASGDDLVVNDGSIDVVAKAFTFDADIPMAAAGVAAGFTESRAGARARGIGAGDGSDEVWNTGDLTTSARATAFMANIPVTGGGVALSVGGPSAEAKATGVDADGDGANERWTTTFRDSADLVRAAVNERAVANIAGDGQLELFDLTAEGVEKSFFDERIVESASGDDLIVNEGVIDTEAIARAPRTAIKVAVVGAAASVANSSAVAESVGVAAGDGSDDVLNSGDLTATSRSNAFWLDVPITGSGLAVTVGGPTAEAAAFGINADGDGRNLHRTTTVDLTTDRIEASSVYPDSRFESSGVDIAYSNERIITSASGDDFIDNTGNVVASATAKSPAINVAIPIVGAAATIADSTARARARAVGAGDGSDEVLNSGRLEAVAKSKAFLASVPITAGGLALAVSGTEAESVAVGIDTDGKGSNSHTTTTIEASGGAVLTDTATGTFEAGGFSATLRDERIVESAGGEDVVVNTGAVVARSTAEAPTVNVAFAGTGVAATISTARSESEAVAIDTGEGSDEIANRGELRAVAKSLARAVNISVVPTIGGALAANAVWDGGTTAEATAVGIEADGPSQNRTTRTTMTADADGASITTERIIESTSGDDLIHNRGRIVARATADAPTVSVAGAGAGVAASLSTSTATARATAIDAGDGHDAVLNRGRLTAEADATAQAVNVSIAPLGGALAFDAVWDGGTTAEATAVGIDADGGESNRTTTTTLSIEGLSGEIASETTLEPASGDDVIENRRAIDVLARADAGSVAVAATLAGVTSANAASTALARATAIDGGAGDDGISTSGDLDVDSFADAGGVSVSFSSLAIAAATADTATRAEGVATGIDGGRGVDQVVNDALIDVESTAGTRSTAVGLGGTVLGTVDANASADASARATGIAGGAGDDTIDNRLEIRSEADSTAVARTLSISLAGGSSNVEATNTAHASAVGIDGEGGDDVIGSGGLIEVRSKADGTGQAISLAEASFVTVADASATADADATGIRGGRGEDMIVNDELVDVLAEADGDARSVGATGLGNTLSAASTDVRATTRGIGGGAGDDTIVNRDEVRAEAITDAAATSASVGLVGSGQGRAGTVADAVATGLDGGGGDDMIVSGGTIDATADAETVTSASSWSLAGFSSATGTVGASARAHGVDGGQGADAIRLDPGTVVVDADATMDASTSTSSGLINAGAGADLGVTAATSAIGVAGGRGSDTIESFSTIDVDGDATMTVGASASGGALFGGSAAARTTATATTDAIGVAGEGGADQVWLHEGADTDVRSAASFSATSTSDASLSLFAENFANAEAAARSTATGVSGGEGSDWIRNEAALTVSSRPTMSVSSSSENGSLFGGASGAAGADVKSEAVGIAGGGGDDVISSRGDVIVRAGSEARSTNSADAAILAGEGSARADTDAVLTSTGIAAGDGVNDVTNTALLRAEAVAGRETITIELPCPELIPPELCPPPFTVQVYDVSSSATADGGGALDGDAIARSDTTVRGRVTGIEGSEGDDHIVNDFGGTVEAVAELIGRSSASADGNGFDGDGVARGLASVSADVVGIRALGGDNSIVNEGTVTVTGDATASVSVVADGDWTGDARVRYVATASATAHGIVSRTELVTALGVGAPSPDGDSDITNSGTIAVTARAETVVADEFDETVEEASSEQANATAVGILTGTGNDRIVSTGTIRVNAIREGALGLLSASAIQTGSGDDTVVIAGTGRIDTFVQGNALRGIGVETGAGDDLVRLLDSSVVDGSIVLGEGADVIAFAGDAAVVNGIITGDAGIDAIRLEDRRTLSLPSAGLLGFERHEVDQGILRLTGSYTIPSGGGLRTELYDGGHGRMDVTGVATIGPDTEITVVARPRTYLDGETFDVLTGSAVTGTFATENLPDSAFVNARVNYLPAAVQVEVGVEPFAAAATDASQRSVGAYLDELAPTASGDVADVIGEFQLLSDRGAIDTAFASLSAESYDSGTLTTFDVGRENGRMLQRRMRGVRAGRTAPVAPANEPASELAMTSLSLGALRDAYGPEGPGSADPADSADPEARPFGFWFAGLGQWGDQDGSAGFTGFDYTAAGATLGLDHLLAESLLGGVSLGYTTTDVDLDGGAGSGDIDSVVLSAYGSWFRDDVWVDAVVSYGRQDYDNRRRVTVGMIDQRASSDHDGDLFAASLSSGFRLELSEATTLEPYGALHYTYLDEDGFTERGAGGANLVVGSRSTDALVSELGLRLLWHRYRHGTLISPTLGIAWVHDFDIDDRSITSGFASAPGSSFTVDGLDLDQDRLRLEAGLVVERGTMAAALLYYGEFAGDYDAHGIMGSVRIEF